MSALKQPVPELSASTKAMLDALMAPPRAPAAALRKAQAKLTFVDPNTTAERLARQELRKRSRGRSAVGEDLVKSYWDELLGGQGRTVERLAFESDPQQSNIYASVYRSKLKLIPDVILKRIAIQDDLTASILDTRANQMAPFGRKVPDRFSCGLELKPDDAHVDKLNQDEKDQLDKRIQRAEKLLMSCGRTEGYKPADQYSLGKFLKVTCRNALTVGRLAAEKVWTKGIGGEREFHSFRPVDAGTIYRAAPFKEAAEQVRDQARSLIAQLKNERISKDKFEADEYAYIQVMDGKPVQAFTDDEISVWDFYPVLDVELDGYPVTPIDKAIAAVTTHINITTHNRMFFQTGRAAKGMLIVKSDDIGPDTITRMKHQFQASINNVSNSWRLPVFSIGSEDEITFEPIDSTGKDMEFQYLSDSNARVIMSAFQISPEELPGYQHLSRGTNSQALSESNNEYKLEAARDVGIRPLVGQFEEFINTEIFPLIDPQLAKICRVKFVGLDAETPEKEATRLGQDGPIHMTYDEILEKVEKEPVGLQWGGQIPLNPQYQQLLFSLFTVGQILERFCGIEGASQDPQLAYRRDDFWFNWVQLQQAAQQPQQPPGEEGEEGGDGEGGGGEEGGGEPVDKAQGPDLTTGIGQVIDLLSKSESKLPAPQRRLLERQRETVARAMGRFEDDLKAITGDIVGLAEGFLPQARSQP